MRDIALALETEERSPPEPIFLGLGDLAAQTGASRADIVQALDDLRALNLIEGPGAFSDSWLFRRFTAKGSIFLSEVRDPRRWLEIKEAYGAKASSFKGLA